MMNNSIERKQQIAYKLNIKRHLLELSSFLRKSATESALVSLKESKRILDSLASETPETTHFTIPFKDKKSPKFYAFIESIFNQIPGPMYVWTEHAVVCGLIQIESIMEFNFEFPFTASNNGIVCIITQDLTNELKLSFYNDELDNEELLEVSLIGKDWSRLRY